MRLGQQIPDGYHLDFEEYLFNTLDHRKTQATHGWQSFYLIDDDKKLIKGSWHLHNSDNRLKSPISATFGGIDFSNNITKEALYKFIEEIDAHLRKEQQKVIELTIAPSFYNEDKFSKLFKVLNDCGYETKERILVSAIHVDEHLFRSKVNTTKKKVLKRTEKLESRELPLKDYSLVYNFILQSKLEKQYELSMTEEELKKVIDSCSDRIKQFAIYVEGEMAAAMICMQVASDILYVFYSGHLTKYDKISPLVRLYQFVYNECRSNGIRLIDLGSSQEDGQPKQTLLKFKSSIGAQNGFKVRFEKKL